MENIIQEIKIMNYNPIYFFRDHIEMYLYYIIDIKTNFFAMIIAWIIRIEILSFEKQ